MTILPGSTIGMLGGGQLGRMFTIAARTMGYDVIVVDPDNNSPAGQLATRHICADYADPTTLTIMAEDCDVVTTEFENIPVSTLEQLAATCPVRPGSQAVTITQDRIHEKTFLRDHNIPTAPFVVIESEQDLATGSEQIGTPAILKVSRFGYDGKGQYTISTTQQAAQGWQALNHEPCVLEQRMPLDIEVSVVLARGVDGQVVTYPIAENIHEHGILDISIVPARINEVIRKQVIETAIHITNELDYIGVMAVEFFVSNGKVLVNEIAPRPHNSGHYTLDACVTDQFEQQVRAVCGLPLGDTRLLSPVVMVNMLGDLWHEGEAPDWQVLLSHDNVKLHLYGKHQARPGRKMGHYNVVAETIDKALMLASEIQTVLNRNT
jgi:5-(carboxyamino)imidazole ribonucleotide synthase